MNKTSNKPTCKPIQPEWLSKSVAGLTLGFILAVGCSEIYMNIANDTALNARVQLAMWIVMPIWLSVFGFVFAFRKGIHAWLTLGGLNLLVFSFVKLI